MSKGTTVCGIISTLPSTWTTWMRNDHNALEKYIFDQVQLYRQIMFNSLFLNIDDQTRN